MPYETRWTASRRRGSPEHGVLARLSQSSQADVSATAVAKAASSPIGTVQPCPLSTPLHASSPTGPPTPCRGPGARPAFVDARLSATTRVPHRFVSAKVRHAAGSAKRSRAHPCYPGFPPNPRCASATAHRVSRQGPLPPLPWSPNSVHGLRTNVLDAPVLDGGSDARPFSLKSAAYVAAPECIVSGTQDGPGDRQGKALNESSTVSPGVSVAQHSCPQAIVPRNSSAPRSRVMPAVVPCASPC